MAWSLELCSECWAIKTGRKLLPQAPARCPRFNSWQAPSNPFSALSRLRMHAGHDGVCRYVHQYSTTYAASNSKGSRTKGVVALGRSCRMSSCKPNVYKVDRRVWAVPVQWAAATGKWWLATISPPLTWGRKGPEIRGSNGRDWTQGQGTTLHHPFIKLQLAAALPPNANHPRASTANSTVLARQARDENLTWGWGDECVYVPTYLRTCVSAWVRTPLPALPPFVCLPLWSLLVASPPPIPGRQHPCP